MAEEAVVKTTVDTKEATKNIKSLKQELRESQKEAQNLASEFGEFDKRTQAAARRAADLRDKLDDVNDAIKSFKGGGVFEAGTRAASALTGGIQAAAGAMAAFGSENENVQKALLKLQGVMALTQGLQALEDLPRAYKQLTVAISSSTIAARVNDAANKAATVTMNTFGIATTGTGAAFNALKVAIIGTGIGALVVLIGYAATKLIEWAGATKDAAKEQEEFNKKIEEGYTKIKQSQSIYKLRLETMKDGIEKEKALRIQSTNEEMIDMAKNVNLKKMTQAEFDEWKKLALIKQSQDLAAIDKKAADEAEKNDKEKKQKKKENLQNELKAEQEANKKRLEAMFEVERLAIDQIKDETEQKKAKAQQAYDEDITMRKANGELTAAYERERKAALELELAGIDKDAKDAAYERWSEADKALRNAKKSSAESEHAAIMENINGQDATIRLGYEGRLQLAKMYLEQGLITQKEYSDAESEINKAKQQNAMDTASAIGNAFGSIGNAIGQNTEFGKVAGVASAVVDTYVGANKALAQGGILGIAGAAGIIASGLANVQRIISVQVPKPPMGGGTGSMSASVSAPTAPPVITQTAIQQSSPIQTTSTGNNRVFVVENDIRSVSNRVDVLQSRGKVG